MNQKKLIHCVKSSKRVRNSLTLNIMDVGSYKKHYNTRENMAIRAHELFGQYMNVQAILNKGLGVIY